MPWLATSYVAGAVSGRRVRAGGPLAATQVLQLAAGLAEGLAAIHAAGVVHRDLKPSNVILAADGPRISTSGSPGRRRQRADADRTWSSARPVSCPPSRLRAGSRPASDMFSLGAVLRSRPPGRARSGRVHRRAAVPGGAQPSRHSDNPARNPPADQPVPGQRPTPPADRHPAPGREARAARPGRASAQPPPGTAASHPPVPRAAAARPATAHRAGTTAHRARRHRPGGYPAAADRIYKLAQRRPLR